MQQYVLYSAFVLLAIIRKGYEEYWHLDDADKEKYHELMALLMALNNDDFWEDKKMKNKNKILLHHQ